MTAPYDAYDYQQYWRGREYEDNAERLAIKRFLNQIPQTKKENLIDIGSAFGRLAETYLSQFKHCLLIDPSDKLLTIARENLKKYTNLEFKQGIGEKLPTEYRSFDVALMIRVMHHVQDPKLVFDEVARILKPGGYFILEFANKIHFAATLKAFLKNDFSFRKEQTPLDQEANSHTQIKTYPFLNHHPALITQELKKSGFEIIDCLSVSNFRHPLIKKIIPLRFLLFLESIFQSLFSSLYLGPSIFLLCQKV